MASAWVTISLDGQGCVVAQKLPFINIFMRDIIVFERVSVDELHIWQVSVTLS